VRVYVDLDRPPLRQRALQAALVRDGGLWREIRVLASTGSTNAVVAEQARAGAAGGLVVVAEHQEAGRGRLDRQWVSPPRAGLTLSVLLRPSAPASADWGWLPLLTGLAVVSALGARAGVTASLKWPNDVLIGDAKVAGVLVEVPVAGAAVLGIGLNVSTTLAELPPGATSLALAGATTVDRDTLLRSLLRDLERWYRTWLRDPKELEQEYRNVSSTIGTLVRVELPGGPAVVGMAEDIAPAGGLVVSGRTYVAGDVVHIRAEHP